MKKWKGNIGYICLAVGILITILGWKIQNFNVITLGLVFVFVNNILFASQSVKERIYFLIFQITFFVFILSRPIFGWIKGHEWWKEAYQAEANVYFALFIVLLSLISLFLGAKFAEAIKSRKLEKNNVLTEKRKHFNLYLQKSSLFVFGITAVFYFIQEFEKLLFMHGKTYVEFYSEFSSKLPASFHTIASFMTYSLCIYLATFPIKKKCFIPLVIFEISAIPSLIIGMRNPIVLNSIFIFLYYIMRDIKKADGEKKWIGKAEKILLTLGTPIGIIFLSLYSYIRNSMAVLQKNPFTLILDFFYGQGVTFDVISIGYGWQNGLPQRAGRNYTFGGMIDYIVHGRIGQVLFKTSPLPDGNSITNAIESNSLAHNLSYVSKKESYLEGHGWGSSYMLENYLDFGYIGVIIVSIVLGFLLVYAIRWLGNKILINTIILISLTGIFFVPRAETTGWLVFIITAQFWICMCGCYICAYIYKLYREKFLKR